jgi:hypothetical protein
MDGRLISGVEQDDVVHSRRIERVDAVRVQIILRAIGVGHERRLLGRRDQRHEDRADVGIIPIVRESNRRLSGTHGPCERMDAFAACVVSHFTSKESMRCRWSMRFGQNV